MKLDKGIQSKGVLISSKDNTERKFPEDALRESEAEYRSLFENSIMGISQALPNGRLIRANTAYAQMYGYANPEEMMAEVTHVGRLYANPEDREEVLRILEAKGIMEPREMVVVHRDGTRFNVLVGARAIKDSEGNLRCYQAELVDITERKRAEEALRESEEKWRSLVNASPDYIALHDSEGRYLFLNHYAEGFTEKDVIGTSLYQYILPESVEIFRGKMESAVNTWTTQHFEYTGLGDLGATKIYEGYLVPLRDKNQEIIILSVSRDITERKQAEEALKQSRDQLHALTTYWQAAIEAERALIAREIHDEFGQSMTALKMDLTWLAKRLPEGDEKLERLAGMNALVDDSIALMRRIATDLRPNLLDDLGLNAALEWQAKEFSNHSGIPCRVNLPEQDLNLDLALSTTLFRIFQEALTNVARHAQATHINANLQYKDQTVILTIQDNGRGISESELEAPGSLGLLGLRERAAQWGGEAVIKGVAGKGTTVTVSIPLAALPPIGSRQ